MPGTRANALSQGMALASAGMLMYAGNHYGLPCTIGQSQHIYLFMPYAPTYVCTNTYMPAGDGTVSHQWCWPVTGHPKRPEHHS